MAPLHGDESQSAKPSKASDRPAEKSSFKNYPSGRRAPASLTRDDIDFALRSAIGEDLGPGDVTSDVLIPQGRLGLGRLISKEEGIVSGLDVFARVFQLLDEHVSVTALAQDGDRIWPGDELLLVEGLARNLLVGERTALNFVQRMSGIATNTFRYVEAVKGKARICDTRKTTPGLRQFEKYAVECGGAINHRFGLFDEVMVKNNHIDLSGNSLTELLFALRASHGNDMRITAEARDAAEAIDAVKGGADCVLLDNMSVSTMAKLCPRLRAEARNTGRPIEIEASGGIDLSTVAQVGEVGVDRISIGALTHSAPSLDLSFRIETRA